MLIFQKRTTQEEEMRMVNMVVIRVLGTFTIAGNALFDAIDMLKKHGMYKQNIKYNANNAIKSYYVVEDMGVTYHKAEQDLFLSTLDHMDEDSQEKVDAIRNEVEQVLIGYGIESDKAKLFAYIQTAKWLIDSTWCLYEKMAKKIEVNYGFKIPNVISFNGIHKVMSFWTKVAQSVCVSNKVININEPRIDCKLHDFTAHVGSAEFINKNTFLAIYDNPKYKYYCSDEEFAELCKKYL